MKGEDHSDMYRLNGIPFGPYKPDSTKRHTLGLVGGNEVYKIKGDRADLESDLQGITRPFTRCSDFQHKPDTGDVITRKNTKTDIKISATPVPLEEYQLWSYAAVHAPQTFTREACMKPEKF